MKVNAKTYITSKLSEIVKSISEIKILYKFDSFTNEHLVKILPRSEYEYNDQYQDFEENLIFDFIAKFPHESLVFLTEGEWIDIDKPDEIFQGVNYFEESNLLIKSEIQFTNILNNELFEISNVDDDLFDLEKIIDSYNIFNLDAIQPLIAVETPIQLNPYFYQLQDNTVHCIFNQNFEKSYNDNHPTLSNCGCNNYALAA